MKFQRFRLIIFILASTLIISSMWSSSQFAMAASIVTFPRNVVELDFPYSMTFRVVAKADEKIETLTLEYGTNADSCVSSVARQPVEIVPGNEIETEWVWDFIDSGSLPMGAQVWWEWEVKLTSGEIKRSSHQTKTIIDQRYSWEQTGSDPADITSINVWYHDTSESFAKELAAIGQKALQSMQTEFGVTPAKPVQFILYNNSDEVVESGLFFSEWAGGYAVPEYNLVVIGVEKGDYDWGKEVINHELAHLISGELTANCLSVSMPTWLSEGFSMYAEGGVEPARKQDIMTALASGKLPPLRTLAGGFAAGTSAAFLSYAQSGMVVEFMIDEYGADKLPQLFAAIQNGDLLEDGLRQVYNLDVDGLDNAWRANLGFAVGEALPTPTATPLPSTVPTMQLFAPFEATETPLPSTTPTQPAKILASLTPTSAPTLQATQASPSGPTLPCLGGNAMILGLFLSFLVSLCRRK